MVYEEENAELIQIGVIFLYINGIIAFFQITDVTETRLYGKIFTEYFFNCFRFGGRLYNQ